MKQEEIVSGFAQLGKLMRALGKSEEWIDFSIGVTRAEYDKLNELVLRQFSLNGWFTNENVRKALLNLGMELTEDKLSNWAASYSYAQSPKKIGIIMAGNIPLVGFHDFLCVVMSGNTAVCKLSSNDSTLLQALASHLVQFIPEIESRIQFSAGKIGQIDAVIATGSDNSLKYFEQYFGQNPHIFRRNRTSLAIIDGNETPEQFKALGEDVFSYFGLGCRNVSHLLIPDNFDLSYFFEGIVSFGEVINNNKYGNNYDYHRAVYLMNQMPILDNNFVLLHENNELFSPLAMIHYHRYSSKNEVESYITRHNNDLQVIVGNEYMDFGTSQIPTLTDYADGVDVMKWLSEIAR